MSNSDMDEVSVVKIGGGLVVVAILLAMVFGTWFTVNQGERVVVLTNGVVSSVKNPGIYFKAPFIQSIERFSVRTEAAKYTGVLTLSKDVQPATVAVTLNYNIDPSKVGDIYSKLGPEYQAKVIDPAVQNTIKVVFGQYSAAESIDSRAKLVKDISDNISAKLESFGIVVDNLSVENIEFSGGYITAVEDRMKAEVAVQQQLQTLAKEKILADIARTLAQGAADSAVMAAKGQAQATQLQGEAEAKAINAKGEALRQNSDLVAYTIAKGWDGHLPTTMLPNQGLPMISLPKGMPSAPAAGDDK
jgi:regulator of protease activity HflC (stomatin/prohibitin superfamily)